VPGVSNALRRFLASSYWASKQRFNVLPGRAALALILVYAPRSFALFDRKHLLMNISY
jgi:hypothetical protein